MNPKSEFPESSTTPRLSQGKRGGGLSDFIKLIGTSAAVLFSVLLAWFFGIRPFSDGEWFIPPHEEFSYVFGALKNGKLCSASGSGGIEIVNWFWDPRVDRYLTTCLKNDLFVGAISKAGKKLKNDWIISDSEFDRIFGSAIVLKPHPEDWNNDKHRAVVHTGGLSIEGALPINESWNRCSWVCLWLFPDGLYRIAEENYLYWTLHSSGIANVVIEDVYEALWVYIYYRDFTDLIEFANAQLSCYGHILSGEGKWSVIWSTWVVEAFSRSFADLLVDRKFEDGRWYSEQQYSFVRERYFSGKRTWGLSDHSNEPITVAESNRKKYSEWSYLGCREIIKSDSDVPVIAVGENAGVAPKDYVTQILDAYDRVLYVLSEQRRFLSKEDVWILTGRFVIEAHFDEKNMKRANWNIAFESIEVPLWDFRDEVSYSESRRHIWFWATRPVININLISGLKRFSLTDWSERNLRTKDEHIEKSLYHELGHYLNARDYANLTNIRSGFSSICWSKDRKTIKDECKAQGFVSEYAQTNTIEDFAETFEEYILYDRVIKKQLEVCESNPFQAFKLSGWELQEYVDFSDYAFRETYDNGDECHLSPQMIKKMKFIDEKLPRY